MRALVGCVVVYYFIKEIENGRFRFTYPVQSTRESHKLLSNGLNIGWVMLRDV